MVRVRHLDDDVFSRIIAGIVGRIRLPALQHLARWRTERMALVV